ncbi:hypothetical protein [Micromonospora sp. NPDC047730]|uniref:hypothetical protein n=1 Tax=Micromonospora sp. NPDC047730 TaxID=3364253 RepID=UPI00371F1475
MTDRDIIERVAELWKVSVASIRPQKEHHKQSFRVILKGARAAQLMLHLRPLLGQRRQAQVDRAVAGWEARPRPLRTPSEKEAEEIVAAVLAGAEPVPAIAARHGIRRESVYRIVRRHRAAVEA